jgi:hypothetical protein
MMWLFQNIDLLYAFLHIVIMIIKVSWAYIIYLIDKRKVK